MAKNIIITIPDGTPGLDDEYQVAAAIMSYMEMNGRRCVMNLMDDSLDYEDYIKTAWLKSKKDI